MNGTSTVVWPTGELYDLPKVSDQGQSLQILPYDIIQNRKEGKGVAQWFIPENKSQPFLDFLVLVSAPIVAFPTAIVDTPANADASSSAIVGTPAPADATPSNAVSDSVPVSDNTPAPVAESPTASAGAGVPTRKWQLRAIQNRAGKKHSADTEQLARVVGGVLGDSGYGLCDEVVVAYVIDEDEIAPITVGATNDTALTVPRTQDTEQRG